MSENGEAPHLVRLADDSHGRAVNAERQPFGLRHRRGNGGRAEHASGQIGFDDAFRLLTQQEQMAKSQSRIIGVEGGRNVVSCYGRAGKKSARGV